ncbi:MAG: Trk system potassium transporter TrkA [Myxococcota bacterium]
MNILVSGDDEVALAIAESLMARHQVVLIHPRGWSAPRLDRLDIDRIAGSASSPEVLGRANIDRCEAFVACTSNDEVNIVSCLAARHLGARRTICMLTRPGFFNAEENDEELARYLGVDVVVRPWEQLAREILRIVTIPGALDVEFLADQRVALLRYSIEEDAPITRDPIKHTPLPPDVTLVMVRRETIFIPNGNTRLRPHDKLTAMGTPHGIRELLFKHLRAPTHRTDRRSATIVGGGVVGFIIASGLEKAGWSIKIIEMSRARCEELAPRLPRSLVLHGDGSDMDLLEEEQIGEAPVLIAVTNNDEKNLLVSMLARSLGVKRIITRADRLTNERLFDQIGVDVVRSAHGAAIRTVVRDVLDPRHEIRAELEHGDIHVLELELPDDYQPVQLKDLHTNLFSIVGAVVRGREVIIARGDTMLQAGDHLFVFCTQADEEKSRELYLDPPASATTDPRGDMDAVDAADEAI